MYSKGFYNRLAGDVLRAAHTMTHGLGHNSQYIKEGHYGGIMADGTNLNKHLKRYPVRTLEDAILANMGKKLPNGKNDAPQKVVNAIQGKRGKAWNLIHGSILTLSRSSFPNLTYIFQMQWHFGTAPAKVQRIQGQIYE